MRFQAVPLGVAVFLGSVVGVWSAPATVDEAHTIRSAVERYLGHGSPDAETVTVTPEGEGYTVAIDLKAMTRPLAAFGVSVDAGPYRLHAAPIEGGLWRVTTDGFPRFQLKRGERSYSVVANGMRSDGVFDPTIPAFTSSASSYDSMSVATLGDVGGSETREQIGGKHTLVATSTGFGGALDAVYTGSLTRSTQDVTLDLPKVKEGAPRSKFTIRSGAVTQTVRFDALQIRALTELWAFFVAHPSREALKAGQDDLRSHLRAALPLFRHMAQEGSVADLAVDSPLGAFSVGSLSGGLALDGLATEGLVDASLKLDRLSLPADLVPGWIGGLLPTGLDLHQTVTGFHLEAPALAAVAGFDLGRDDIFTPAQAEAIRAAVGPFDDVRVKMAPSRITSQLLDITYSGDIRFAQPVPELRLTVTAKGLDAAVKSIQAAGKDDATASQAIAAIMLAKGYGTSEPDGSTRWTIANAATGDITVNGIALPIGKQ